ncbi:MAG TPA: DUF4430 domain-containing protein [Patescibacteria group bacterium]|nr:DUF4430 domain-containing protein [Patescibacteria group bacterium]
MANNKGELREISSWGWGNFLALVILAVILILGGSALGNSVSKKQAQKSTLGTSEIKPVVEKIVAYDGEEGKTALEILKTTHKVAGQDTSIGVFVTGIDEVENADNKYWMFYVDGKLATAGADQYKTKNGEKIEWRYGSLE